MAYGAVYETTSWGKTDKQSGWGLIYFELIVRPLASTTKILADSIRHLASRYFE
jgi:hypothetical protein